MQEQGPQGQKRRPSETIGDLHMKQQDEREAEERVGQQKSEGDPEEETMEPMWMDELMLVQAGPSFIDEIT